MFLLRAHEKTNGATAPLPNLPRNKATETTNTRDEARTRSDSLVSALARRRTGSGDGGSSGSLSLETLLASDSLQSETATSTVGAGASRCGILRAARKTAHPTVAMMPAVFDCFFFGLTTCGVQPVQQIHRPRGLLNNTRRVKRGRVVLIPSRSELDLWE